MRKSVERFANLMEKKLQKHDGERGSDGWKDESIEWLLGRAFEEMGEAQRALKNCDPEELREEVVDVANFLMMVTENLKIPEEWPFCDVCAKVVEKQGDKLVDRTDD